MAQADIDDPGAALDRVDDPQPRCVPVTRGAVLPLTRIGITRQRQQCPAIPSLLLPRAAITLADSAYRAPMYMSCGSLSLSTKS